MLSLGHRVSGAVINSICSEPTTKTLTKSTQIKLLRWALSKLIFAARNSVRKEAPSRATRGSMGRMTET